MEIGTPRFRSSSAVGLINPIMALQDNLRNLSSLSAPSPVGCSNAKCLRVGVILNSRRVPAWVKQVLKQLDNSERLELALIAYDNAVAATELAWTALEGVPDPLFFRVWAWLDYQMFRNRACKPDATKDVDLVLGQSRAKIVELRQPVGDTELNSMKEASLDVLLDFTGKAATEIHRCARHGMWTLGTVPRLARLLARNMCEQRTLFEIAIEARQNGAAQTFGGARFATDFLSLYRNYNRYCWAQAEAVVRDLEDLRQSGTTTGIRPIRDHEGRVAIALRGNSSMILLLLRTSGHILHTALKRLLYREDWFIAYRKFSPLPGKKIGPGQIAIVRAPIGRFYADPFVVEKNGATFLFFEDYSYASKKAVISLIEIDAAGKPGKPETVLEADYHLSYPCVFEWQGEMYMIPETKQNRTIELYRATNFPRQWKRERVLMTDTSTVDSTIIRYGNKFWLFTSGMSSSEKTFAGDESLFLFFSATPFGPWQPHPKNPIVTDVRTCRPAGHLFVEDGQLIRPSQDCSQRYGGAVCFSRVDTLSEEDYAETPIAELGADWLAGNLGCHTFNQSPNFQVVDGRTLLGRFIPSWFRRSTFVFFTESATPLFHLAPQATAHPTRIGSESQVFNSDLAQDDAQPASRADGGPYALSRNSKPL